jgi:serine/threonine protein kinase
MPAVNPCPEQSAYQRLIHGELPPADVEHLSQHLAACSSCAAVVQTLLGEDSLLSAIRGAPAGVLNGDEVPTDLIRRLLALPAPSPGEQRFVGAPSLAPPQAAGEIGRLAHYRVLQVLGEGGMGVVFLAEDTRLSRAVALKAMKPEIAADPRHRQRFLREAQAAAKVEDDHIAPIYDVGEDRGVPWLAMPLLKGQSLDDLLKQEKVLKPVQAMRLGAQVARGLAAAHAVGLIHRDVKPANIWVEPTGGGRARLLDFGLARDQNPPREQGQEQLTGTGAILGTPAFMAPEQAASELVDARADLFSLGCVLYRAVTGRLPFQGLGTMDTLRALATQTPPSPHEVNPEVPQPLAALIMNLLAKERSARPSSAAAVAAALESLHEQATSPVQPTLSVAPRRWWWLATAATLLLALSGAMAAGIVVIIKNKDGKETGRVIVPDGSSIEIKPGDDSDKPKVDPADVKPDHRAAEWVLSIGGTIRYPQDGKEREIKAAKDLATARLELVWIGLDRNQKVDDAGLEHLKGLTYPTILYLGNTRVSDEGLAHLKEVPNLKGLDLGFTEVNGAGLVHLQPLTSLTWIRLQGSRANDIGLTPLEGLTNLTWLHLGGTRVSDAGLVHLKGLTKLARLDLTGTQVTADGVAGLQKALPKCKIFWDGNAQK